MGKFTKVAIAAGLAGATIALAASAFAAKPNADTTRPGWGYGDKNHVHTGPPGQSVHP